MQDTRSVYILLMRSGTAFSRLIHFLTKSEYTHTSIGLSPDCRELYSFARKYASLPIPAGFTRENITTGLMGKFPDTPCALYKLDIPKDTFLHVQAEIDHFKQHKKPLKYSLTGPILCWIGYEAKQRKRFFCSRFVADILERSGAAELEKPASLYKPIDFTRMQGLTLVYEGTLGELASQNHEAEEPAVCKV